MSSFDELRKEFDEKVAKLKETCKHPTATWCEEWWAIAHSTGDAVKVCDVCSKFLEKVPLSEAYKKGYLKDPQQWLREQKEEYERNIKK